MTWNATTADGVWKEVFGKLEETVPEYAILQKRYPHNSEIELGKEYTFPVRLRRSHGVTFASGNNSMDAFALNAPVTGQLKPAAITGSTCVIRERMAYKASLAAMEAGKKAFASLYAEAVADTWRSLHFYLEALMLYGQTGFGIFEDAGSSAASITVDLTPATSAPGLFAQMEGAPVDVWSPTFSTKRNTNGALTVSAMNFELTGTNAGKVRLTLTGAAADNAAIVAGDVIVPLGFYDSTNGHQTMPGFDKICTNSGSLFGIDASQFPTWAGNTLSMGNAEMSFHKAIKAQILIAVRCGLSESPLDVWISPMSWSDMNSDVAAVRRSAGNEKGRVEFGAREIVYYGVTGEMIMRPHPLVKGGEFFAGMEDYVTRSGVTKPTFEHPAPEGQSKFLRELADNAGFEFRGMWDQFVVNTKPRSWVKGTEIVNSVS